MAARRSSTLKDDERFAMLRRIDALEQRVMRLEARVRRDAAEARARNETGRQTATVVRATLPEDGPCCPVCFMPIAKGSRAVECAWCGFRLDVLAGFAPRKRRAR